jgi:hypothetical protein
MPMPTRRDLLRHATLGTLGTLGLLASSAFTDVFADEAAADKSADKNSLTAFKGQDVFDRLLKTALAKRWQDLPIGQCMARVAMELEGTPYVGFTLELDKDREICSVNLTGLDCVTFFEDTLDFARMLQLGGRTPQAMLEQVTLTRYRGGNLGDFTTRLHYTTDWMSDNATKGVVKLLAPDLPGAEKFTQPVGIMSASPNNYRQLKAHPEFIPVIKRLEDQINARNARETMYVPMNQLAAAQGKLQSGDIVGVATTEPGIDIAHTGLVIVDDSGVPHFMDASSSKRKMKVTLEPGPIANALNWSSKLTGAVFARPQEPAR